MQGLLIRKLACPLLCPDSLLPLLPWHPRASEANAAGVPQGAARNAVVALCWISAFMFFALLVTNCILIKRLGRCGVRLLLRVYQQRQHRQQ